MPEFWKTWNKKFCKNLSSHTTVDGHSNGSEIAVVFSDKFRSVYYDSASNSQAMQEYVDEFQNVVGNKGYEFEYCIEHIDVAILLMNVSVALREARLVVLTTLVQNICNMLIIPL